MTHEPTRRLSRPVALVVAAALFLEIFDGTVLATAAPVIAGDFGLASADIGVAMTAYLLAVAAFIPVGGWLAERLGARRLFIAAILVFVFASALCAISTDLTSLTLARVMQGIAGSMMVPIGRLIVISSAAKSELITAVAYMVWPALAAPVLAPIVGGALAQTFGWQSIFLVNIPLGLILVFFAWRLLPELPHAPRRPFDARGFLLVTVTVTALVLGFEFAVDPGATPRAIISLAVAALAGALALRRLTSTPEPYVQLWAYRVPTFRITNSSGVLYRAVVGSAPFLLPLLLQDGFGWTPIQAGAMVLWIFVGNIGIKPLTTPMLRAWGFAPVMVGAGVGIAATFALTAFLTPDTPAPLMAILLVISGACRSAGFTAYNTIQYADVPPERLSGANVLAATLEQLANGIGIAIAAVLARLLAGAAPLVAADSGEATGIRWAFLIAAGLALVAAASALRLPNGSGAEVRGR